MNQQIEDIKAIREMMEKSSKFLSLTGITGIVIGIIATLGALFLYFYLLRDPSLTDYNSTQETLIILGTALLIVLLSMGCGAWFSAKKAKREQQKISRQMMRRTLYNLSVPIIIGGVVCSVLLFRGDLLLATALTLIFYGLALINISKYTNEEIHYLGLTELIIGILAVIFSSYVLLFWIAGFGICHILYGTIMHLKYDHRNQ